jgi:hypothetical protein
MLDAPALVAPVLELAQQQRPHQRPTGPPQVERGEEAFSAARVFFGGGRSRGGLGRDAERRSPLGFFFYVRPYSRLLRLFFFFSEFRLLHLCGGQKSTNRPVNGSFNVVTVKI